VCHEQQKQPPHTYTGRALDGELRLPVAGCWRSGWELGPGLGCAQDAPRTTGGEEGAAARLVEWRCRSAATPSTTATGEANRERWRHVRIWPRTAAGVPATRWDGMYSLAEEAPAPRIMTARPSRASTMASGAHGRAVLQGAARAGEPRSARPELSDLRKSRD
jgi:hypothetical protein